MKNIGLLLFCIGVFAIIYSLAFIDSWNFNRMNERLYTQVVDLRDRVEKLEENRK